MLFLSGVYTRKGLTGMQPQKFQKSCKQFYSFIPCVYLLTPIYVYSLYLLSDKSNANILYTTNFSKSYLQIKIIAQITIIELFLNTFKILRCFFLNNDGYLTFQMVINGY